MITWVYVYATVEEGTRYKKKLNQFSKNES
jgi:hypothetical protein